ncbi:MAG TPA: roadblock/LC7 domain-containing protein [Gemmatimonadales bacterium]|nr:roadblock/LC7 domain-containing protein [Gemmatimonadales bacterium]
MTAPGALLERVCSVRGIRGAVLVSAADGLVVAESLMAGVDGRAVAALAASLVNRLGRAVEAAGRRAPLFVQLAAESGSVLAVVCGSELVLVAVTSPDANIGLARLELLEAAGRLA